MTSNTTPHGTCYVYAGFSSHNEPYKAWNGDSADYFTGTGTVNYNEMTHSFYFGHPVRATHYQIAAYAGNDFDQAKCPGDWSVWGVNAQGSFLVDTRGRTPWSPDGQSVTGWTNGEVRTYFFTSSDPSDLYETLVISFHPQIGQGTMNIGNLRFYNDWALDKYATAHDFIMTTSDEGRITLADYQNVALCGIVDKTTPSATLSYAVSFDGRATWKTYQGGQWVTTELTSAALGDNHIAIQSGLSRWSSSPLRYLPQVGNSKAELEAAINNMDGEHVPAALTLMQPNVDYEIDLAAISTATGITPRPDASIGIKNKTANQDLVVQVLK